MEKLSKVTARILRDASLARCTRVQIIEGKSDCDAHQDTAAAVGGREVSDHRETVVIMRATKS